MENIQGTDYVLEIDTVTDPNTEEYGTEENYRLIACLVSNGIDVTLADQTTSNKCSGGWAESLSGEGSWTFPGEGQAVSLSETEEETKTNFQAIALLAIEKTVFFARMTNAAKDIYREGKVRISSYSESAPNNEPYTFTVTFTGIGKPRMVAPTT